MTERLPADEAGRRAAATDLATTYLVEAGAGTGKTRLLVERYVSCLRTGAPAETVVAITFTEKAAGELRQRIRERLEVLLDDGDPAASPLPEHERARLETALAGLDAAPISTIHAFAAGLLRERPVEAVVDPAFTQLDEAGARLFLERVWGEWLASLLDEQAGAEENGVASAATSLASVLAAEVDLEALRSLACVRYRERYAVAPAEPPSVPSLGRSVGALKREALAVADAAAHCSDRSDRLWLAVRGLCAALAELPDEGDADHLGAALGAVAARRAEFGAGNVGRAGNWPAGGKDEMLTLRGGLLDAVEAAAARYRAYVAARALHVAEAFAAYAERRRQLAGALDFDDLLGKARDLVRGDPRRFERTREVRRHLQSLYRYLLVDEFQDTDPLQAEIVFFLAEREPRARAWREVELEPGKLFLVGDPKQSIYRFRRADIAMYHDVAEVIGAQGGRVVSLTQNFRTVPSAIAYANRVFADLIGPEPRRGLQPGYAFLAPWRDEPPGQGAVVALHAAEEHEGLGAARRRAAEAELVAAFLRGLEEEGWEVGDGSGGRRAATFDDVALLFRTYTGVGHYERALRDAGLPFTVEGGRTYFAQREVADGLACLGGIDDVADPVALYGALHAAPFGFSDDDLFAFRHAGGRFDCFAAQPDGHDEIAAALALLAELHERRDRRPLASTVDELFRRTCYLEAVAAWSDRPRQALANLGKLERLAGDRDARGGMTFREFVAELREQVDEGVAGEPVDEGTGRGVRLLTIHKAKGLEFPVVVLADPAGEFYQPEKYPPLIDRRSGRLDCSLKGSVLVPQTGAAGSVRFATEGYEERREWEAQALACERLRLLYVAMTRARDLLVLPLVEAPQESKQRSPLELLGPHLPARDQAGDGVVRVLVGGARGGGAARRPPARPDPAGLLEGRRRWAAARAALLEGAARAPAAPSPSALEEVSPVASDGRSAAARREALAVGSAVHRVLEIAPLEDEAELALLAAFCAAEAGVSSRAEEVLRLVGAVWRSEPVRAAAKRPHRRELPLRWLREGEAVSGAVDLAYRADDGWVLADYKTDRDASREVVEARYGAQAAAYVLRFEEAGGGTVARFAFVLAAVARDGVAQTVWTAVDETWREVARGLAGGS